MGTMGLKCSCQGLSTLAVLVGTDEERSLFLHNFAKCSNVPTGCKVLSLISCVGGKKAGLVFCVFSVSGKQDKDIEPLSWSPQRTGCFCGVQGSYLGPGLLQAVMKYRL